MSNVRIGWRAGWTTAGEGRGEVRATARRGARARPAGALLAGMRLACAALALPLVGAGCQNVESVTIPNVFRVVPERPLADVPVPIGFRLKHRGSYVFNDNYRVARIHYTGGVAKAEIEAFYKSQMPLSRWTLTGETGEEERLLTFHNDEETCTVTFNRRGGVSTIDIVVEPRAAPGVETQAVHAEGIAALPPG